VVLLMITVLNVYKPQGLTAYGWRKQQAQRAKLALRSSVANQQELSAPVATVSGPSALAASDPNGRAADERSARPRRTAT
jgi:hypothetical protein